MERGSLKRWPMFVSLSWAVQRQSRGWDTDVQLCLVLKAAGRQSIWWHRSLRYVHVAWDAVGLPLFGEGKEAEAVAVLVITRRDYISWNVKKVKEGMKPGKQI